jgi:Fuc2NAc and GlcNAc transferase
MVVETAVLAVGAFVVAAALTGMIRRVAIARGMLDVPNDRSSHDVPTPRGGGLAIVVATLAGLIVSSALGAIPRNHLIALVGGSLAIALVGYMDDRRGLSARVRLVVHLAAAIWAVWWLGGLPSIRFGREIYELGLVGHLLSVLGIVWTLNLFNFMDGIDGLAASEAVFIAWGAAALAALSGSSSDVTTVSVVLGAACCGFLYWNWPPARIFMGDAGSGFLGFVLAVLALAASRDNAAAPAIWLLLGGVFFVDATVTLLRRLTSGQRLHQAHRTHAYQWLARRWNSHQRVTLVVLAVNVAWLFPAAAIASRYPRAAVWLVLAAWLPLIVVAVWVGAGRREGSAERTTRR